MKTWFSEEMKIFHCFSKAIRVLKTDEVSTKSDDGARAHRAGTKSKKETRTCYHCGKEGHLEKNCLS